MKYREKKVDPQDLVYRRANGVRPYVYPGGLWSQFYPLITHYHHVAP